MREIFGIIVLMLLGSVAWIFIHGFGTVAPLDWIIALLTLLWLIGIVTVPWNIYFQTRAILVEAEESKKRDISVEEHKIAYAKRWSERALVLALVLHLATALGMYFLAAFGVSFIGYFGAGAALMLTVVRPVVRGYEYVRKRLATIREETTYPREDVVSLKAQVEDMKATLEMLEKRLDASDSDSWAAKQEQNMEALRTKLDLIRHRIDDALETNKLDHEKISRDAQNAMAQAMADAAIVNHVREIVRFFKEA